MNASTDKLRLPDYLREKFEELKTDNDLLMLRAKLLWAQTIDDLGLQGTWRYVDGYLCRIDVPEPK